MTNLILANGTTLELQDNSTLANMLVVFPTKEAMVEAWDAMKPANLASVTIKNENDTVIAEYNNLVLVSVNSTEQEDGSILTSFMLREKTETELLKEQTAMLTECLLEISEVVYGG